MGAAAGWLLTLLLGIPAVDATAAAAVAAAAVAAMTAVMREEATGICCSPEVWGSLL
jgi:hypothetical protein